MCINKKKIAKYHLVGFGFLGQWFLTKCKTHLGEFEKVWAQLWLLWHLVLKARNPKGPVLTGRQSHTVKNYPASNVKIASPLDIIW